MKKTGLVLLVLIILVLVGATEKTNAASILIPVAEFIPDGNTGYGSYSIHIRGGYLAGSADYPCFVAPVRIPTNATKITKVVVYLQDWGLGTSNPYFTLDAINMATGSTESYLATEVSTDNGGELAIELSLDKKSLVKGRVYQLGACLDEDQWLYGAKVVYTLP